ncbi:MAG: Fe-S-containing protein [Dehalococcoidales bacterium]|nr:Fe-S-containing protein [Dehalococcoidales bacterium]
MNKLNIILIVVLLAVTAALLGACSGSSSIRATRVTPAITEDMVSLQYSEIQANKISSFSVATTSGEISFMAYDLDGKIYARADICPPCRSDSFSLNGTTLVCDTCATVFDARTGKGLKGACVNYPKALVPFTENGGKLIMKGADLLKAYQDTLQPG